MADGKRERKQATVTSLPNAARPTSRGDVPPQLSAKAIRTYETQADEEGALETELATIASLLDGKSPEDRRRLLEQLLERETQATSRRTVPCSIWNSPPAGAMVPIPTRI